MDHREEYISNFHDVAVAQQQFETRAQSRFATRAIMRQRAGKAITAGRQ
jgi:cytochrome c-type biogenesis protein CcmH/NrfG